MIHTLIAALFCFLPPPDAFAAWFQENGVQVEKAVEPGSALPWIRGIAELDAPPADVANLLGDFAAYPQTFAPIYASVAVLDTRAAVTRVHQVWAYPWPLRDRDAVVAYTRESRPDGSVVLEWKGDAREGDPASGVRISVVEGRTEIVPLAGGRSRATYTYYGDLGGDFGRSRNEKAWRTEPVHYFESLRRALAAR